MATPPDPAPVFCARCAVELHPGRSHFYQVHIEALADPTPPILPAEATAAELRRQIEQVIAQMGDISAQEAMDQVYRRLTLHLCAPCYRQWIENPTGWHSAEGSEPDAEEP